jgi:hypothetical protein
MLALAALLGMGAHDVAHPSLESGVLIGRTVRDIHGAYVGTVRAAQRDAAGTVTNVVIKLGHTSSGGERYVVVPRDHLVIRRGVSELVFSAARERLVDAPRRAGRDGE